MNNPPPIQELLPHRGTMLLLDRLIKFTEAWVEVEYSPRRGAWYADDSGNMPGWIGIELMAQAAAVHVAMQKRQAGLPGKMGALLGTRSYHSMVKNFMAGEVLQIKAQEVLRDETGLAVYDCFIQKDGGILATSTLKAYEPDDFKEFMQGNNS